MAIEPFALHVLSVPGSPGSLALARMPGRSGDLAGDVAVIRAWRADLVVSMTEGEELRAGGGGDLPALLAAAGIAWRHFPVVDFGGPPADDPRWPPLADELHALLARGGRIVLHCAGGCGRSGMVAMRLLVASGLAPRDALAHLRAVRACAVETEEQALWAALG